jgi:asparagine synthetase B (glutamine-hydrolysing)
MYAFVLVDKKAGRILLARDPLGKQPFFLGRFKDRLYFSSRIQSIAADLSPNELQLSRWGLGYLMDLGFIPAPFSALQNIEKLVLID